MIFGDMAAPYAPPMSAAQKARLVLPRIPHPSERVGNPKNLQVQGVPSREQHHPSPAQQHSRHYLSAENRAGHRVHNGAGLDRNGGKKIPSRAMFIRAVDQLEDGLCDYLRSGGFYNMKASFKAFDPKGDGHITKEALMRAIGNVFPDVTPEQFRALLARVNLNDSHVINFDDFFQAFRSPQDLCETWVDPVTRRAPKLLNAGQTHMILKDMVKEGDLTPNDLSESKSFAPPRHVVKPDFKDLLKRLQLAVDPVELDKLWLRYDIDNRGIIPISQLFAAMGRPPTNGSGGGMRRAGSAPCVSRGDGSSTRWQRGATSHHVQVFGGVGGVSSAGGQSIAGILHSAAPGHSAGYPASRLATSRQHTAGKSDTNSMEMVMLRTFNQGYMRILTAMKEHDVDNSGYISTEEFRSCLAKFGIRLAPSELGFLLLRCGFDEHAVVVAYENFLEKFINRQDGGVVSAIIADASHQFHRGDAFDTDGQAANATKTTDRRSSKPPGKPTIEPGAAVDHAESRLMSLLQGNFLTLLGAFQTIDPKHTGAVSLEECRKVLHRKLDVPIRMEDLVRIVERVPDCNNRGRVCYSQLLLYLDAASRDHVQCTFRKMNQVVDGSDVSTDRVNEITRQIRKSLHSQLATVTDAFHDMDFQNTGKLTQTMLQGLLLRIGVKLSWSEVVRLWSTMLRTANNTLDFQEFIRHFCPPNPPQKQGKPVGKHMTDDHYLMRSKKLHRDEDIVMDRLRSMLTLAYYTVLKKFVEQDPMDSGMLSMTDFVSVLKCICPLLTEAEAASLGYKHQNRSDRISYKSFLAPYRPSDKTYRVGNDMSGLLSQYDGTVVVHTNPPVAVAGKPNKGLPGTLAALRRKLQRQWKPLVHGLRRIDPLRTGYVSLDQLRTVFSLCGIEISKKELFHLSDHFDKDFKQQIDYNDFVRGMMG
ncbi:EF-hand calcium-binding domain-containing protein 6-like [Sycon ciliatum]|uniref:EF-hand calcium-binding domain-containing protein 6-like n=1 Tax=Sycon ciliatum TaxID=27933 RepID=UPI0031F62940